ncbi:dihydrofolate reductase [Demequina sp. TTPB684]|uniref:dihydrofolate reductase n=1 Tax=unclassified Demequina TaxID=2620311 RepID=UPI001CF53268|nr:MULTISPECIES: dihydrofolate reductase [unclassified Demequina]MCB2413715.1 dihydrofolate reductase [Demequina sp. TTPB684]UPU89612.1 dihydrofolate reductase [Demequina sp. TMPB413]
MIKAIWAQARDAAGRPVIGLDGGMPWHLPEDLAHFQTSTTGHAVIMGRRTWESLPPRFRPLTGRENIVVSRSLGSLDGATIASSLADAIDAAARISPGTDAWIIGGAGLFEDAAAILDEVVVTEIDLVTDGDTFAPELSDENWRATSASTPLASRTGLGYRIVTYRRRQDAT